MVHPISETTGFKAAVHKPMVTSWLLHPLIYSLWSGLNFANMDSPFLNLTVSILT